MKMKKYDVSIICCTYNSDINKLAITLNSLLNQDGCSFEVIIADDGSVDNHKDFICNYFKRFNFQDYKLCLNKDNKGTVKNIFKAIKLADGKYIKPISPGDCLYCETTLKNLIAFANQNAADIVFADAVGRGGIFSFGAGGGAGGRAAGGRGILEEGRFCLERGDGPVYGGASSGCVDSFPDRHPVPAFRLPFPGASGGACRRVPMGRRSVRRRKTAGTRSACRPEEKRKRRVFQRICPAGEFRMAEVRVSRCD